MSGTHRHHGRDDDPPADQFRVVVPGPRHFGAGRPRRLRDAAPATTLVATFAVAFALEAIWLIAFGARGESADLLSSLNKPAIQSGDVTIRWVTIAMLGVGGLLLGGTTVLLNRTKIGLQMRAEMGVGADGGTQTNGHADHDHLS